MTLIMADKKPSRPSWDEYFLKLSDLVSTRSTCPRLQVGAILVCDRMIISTGYNGAPKKIDDCYQAGCRLEDNHCTRTVHAEVNSVIQAAYHGISTKGSTLYTRYYPCEHCAKVLINAGVERVVYTEVYQNIDRDFATDLFKQAGIKVEQIKI